jgi:stage II sporulation protein AA (anti-sigma F factor antagonist)
MQITEQRDRGVVVVAPLGRIDSTTSAALEGHVLALVRAGERRMVIDFAGTDYISSAGLRVMLVLAKGLRTGPGGLVFCAMTEPVRQVFDLAGFLPLFVIEPSRDAAIARLVGA